jgi:hypothetical protein
VDRIFISYRRDDAGGYAANLVRDLREAFGNQVYQDVERSLPGDRFRSRIDRTLARCDVVVVVIGPGWLNRDEHGRRRLDDPDDILRQEIEAALGRDDLAVVPVLVGGARQPQPAEMPDALRPLLDCAFHRLEEGPRRKSDVSYLTSVIRGYTDAGSAVPAALAAIAAVALLLWPVRAAALALLDGREPPEDAWLRMVRIGALHAFEWALLVGAAAAAAALVSGRRPGRAAAVGGLAAAIGGIVGGALDQVLREGDHESLGLVVGVLITAPIAALGGFVGRANSRTVIAAALGAFVGALLTLVVDDRFWDYGLPVLGALLAVAGARLAAARSVGRAPARAAPAPRDRSLR